MGGQACSVSRWPWQVALIANGEQVCGGSLVTADWIVTAAHCFDSGFVYSFFSMPKNVGMYCLKIKFTPRRFLGVTQ